MLIYSALPPAPFVEKRENFHSFLSGIRYFLVKSVYLIGFGPILLLKSDLFVLQYSPPFSAVTADRSIHFFTEMKSIC